MELIVGIVLLVGYLLLSLWVPILVLVVIVFLTFAYKSKSADVPERYVRMAIGVVLSVLFSTPLFLKYSSEIYRNILCGDSSAQVFVDIDKWKAEHLNEMDEIKPCDSHENNKLDTCKNSSNVQYLNSRFYEFKSFKKRIFDVTEENIEIIDSYTGNVLIKLKSFKHYEGAASSKSLFSWSLSTSSSCKVSNSKYYEYKNSLIKAF